MTVLVSLILNFHSSSKPHCINTRQILLGEILIARLILVYKDIVPMTWATLTVDSEQVSSNLKFCVTSLLFYLLLVLAWSWQMVS